VGVLLADRELLFWIARATQRALIADPRVNWEGPS
jgi:hypothetical protein